MKLVIDRNLLNMRPACKRTSAFILFLFAFVISAGGQPKCKVEYYSTEQGLSHQAVTSMMKDREGFMWFGTWDGINRFDGRNFVSFRSSPGDKSQLRNDRIDQVVEDQSNHLWIKAYDRQVYRFDKKTEQFFHLSSIISSNKAVAFSKILKAGNGFVWLQSADDGIFCVEQHDSAKVRFVQYNTEQAADYRLPSNTINLFYEDHDHRMWIATSKGLRCLARSASGIYKKAEIIPFHIVDRLITAVDEDKSHIYFSTADGDIINFDKSLKTFYVQKITTARINSLIRSNITNVLYATTTDGKIITVNLGDRKYNVVTYNRDESLYSIYEDKSGVLWIEPRERGVIRFNPANSSFSFFSQKIEDPNNVIGNRFKVFEDNQGTVWINMKGGGFGYYNVATSSMDYMLNVANMSGYRLPNVVYAFYYDKAGILWLRVHGRELVKIVFLENHFKQQLLVDKEPALGDNEVRGILSDNKNRLWLGAKSGKLYVRQNDKWIKGLFENEPPQGLGQVYTIFQDSRNNIWFGTKKNGLFKAIAANPEGTKYRLQNFVAGEKNINSLTSNQIYSVLEDMQGRIWVGTFDKGLVLVLENHDATRFIHKGDAFKNYPKQGFEKIRHMALDGAGNIWIGSTDGLVVLNTSDNHSSVYNYKTYSKISGDKKSLGNNDVQFVYRDSKNRMWLSTSGGGLCHAEGNNPFTDLRFHNYTTRDGLPNDYILSCTEDRQGNLWLATENGLSKFNPENNTFRNYDSYDGLSRTGFSEAAVSRQLPDGNLVFGTTDGYIIFNPDQINPIRISANIAFTNLQINNENIEPSTDKDFLKTHINYISELTLKYNQNIISIDYAVPDYRSANRQAFAYRLIGFDSTWHDGRQLRRTTYTNLPPGHYVFEVKSLNTEFYVSTPFKRLAITIFPPPWKTWWAYTGYVIVILLVLALIRRYALVMTRLRHKVIVEQKLAALKLNFFTNVSHELRTPLTLIVNPLEQLSQKEKLSPKGMAHLEVARKNANRMVRFINQLLDLRKVQSDKATLQISRIELVSFIKKVCDHFTEAAASKQIKLEILSEQEELLTWLDADKLDVVIYNLLGNALKFTPEGKAIKVLIRSIPEENSFSIVVHDQGPGVKKEMLEEIFELFNEGDHSGERAFKGSGIGLALCREFVHLHGGTIWAENNEDGGLIVTVKMNVGLNDSKKDVTFVTDAPKNGGITYETPIGQQILALPSSNTLSEGHEAPLVLLVEDNAELRLFLQNQLSEFYRVEVAKDGKEGWQKAVSLLPELIVSDIMMPVMDGIQMLDKIKNDITTSHIPVVLLSAKYSIESQIEGLKYGADYYITKPFNNEFLIASINNLLRQRKKLFESLIQKKSIPLSPGTVVVTSKDEIFLKDVIRTVEEKMADPEFNIETVAETIRMSRTTFYKKFKCLTGLAPVEFVSEMRLQRARQYLDAGGNNVSEVAYLVGFANPKYFSTCFKEKYQVSPSDYLKSKLPQRSVSK